MVSQVGLDTTAVRALPALPALQGNNAGENTNSSVFKDYSSIPTNSYANDIFMSTMDFSKLIADAQQTNAQSAQAFQGAALVDTQAVQGDTGAEPKKSNKFKILGALGGLLTPVVLKAAKAIKKSGFKAVASKALTLLKGGKFKELLTKKGLLVSCPIFGVVGLGIGMLIDGCMKSRRAKNTEEQNQLKDQQQKEIIRNFISQ